MESQYSDIDDIPIVFEVQPYMFEPAAVPNPGDIPLASAEDSDEDPGHKRSGTFWCECGLCQVMSSSAECVCCTEISVVDQARGDLECITQHQTFKDNCLNTRVLEVSLYDYVQSEGPLDDNEPIHEVYRYIAYRRFVLWVWQKLGKGNRKILPACVVTTIRNAFPSEQYTGFKYARPM
ncbi:P2X purinoceptor 7-like [Ostrea edulis]|uniref:P2X purinoceptor 7-like n=1 Tax=Ostrea edulis TaxID=37623 RepID=UPI00209556B0|nr:P2X purinoceptor 7-like [Ostrea edulis]